MRPSRSRLPLAILLFTLAAPAARAADEDTGAAPAAEAVDDDENDGLRFSMGFLAGSRTYRRAGFSLDSGAIPGGASLSEPFLKSPYSGVYAPGVTWNLSAVLSRVRMSIGFDLAFPSFDGTSKSGLYELEGSTVEVTPRSISSRQLHLGLGGEYPVNFSFGKVACFLDLYGNVDWITTDLSVGGLPASYKATAFGFSLHGGIQWYMRKHFFSFLSGEYGLSSTVEWTGRFGVGFAIF